MSTFIRSKITFPSIKKADRFSGWLYREDYTNKKQSGRTVEVTLPSHGDLGRGQRSSPQAGWEDHQRRHRRR